MENPITTHGNTLRIWGTPVELGWWQQQPVDLAHSLCRYDKDHGACFTALIAAALEQLTSWVASGLKVKGRTWVDVGGGSGYYSIALRLLGAASVTLIDPIQLDKWAEPVCGAAGVRVITADGNNTSIQEADSALLLYVPDVGVRDVLVQHPHLTQIVTEDTCFMEEWISGIGWKEREMTHQSPFFVLGDDGATVNDHNTEYSNCESLLSGPVVSRPVPDLILCDYSEPIFNDADNEDNLPDRDAENVPF